MYTNKYVNVCGVAVFTTLIAIAAVEVEANLIENLRFGLNVDVQGKRSQSAQKADSKSYDHRAKKERYHDGKAGSAAKKLVNYRRTVMDHSQPAIFGFMKTTNAFDTARDRLLKKLNVKKHPKQTVLDKYYFEQAPPTYEQPHLFIK